MKVSHPLHETFPAPWRFTRSVTEATGCGESGCQVGDRLPVWTVYIRPYLREECEKNPNLQQHHHPLLPHHTALRAGALTLYTRAVIPYTVSIHHNATNPWLLTSFMAFITPSLHLGSPTLAIHRCFYLFTDLIWERNQGKSFMFPQKRDRVNAKLEKFWFGVCFVPEKLNGIELGATKFQQILRHNTTHMQLYNLYNNNLAALS